MFKNFIKFNWIPLCILLLSIFLFLISYDSLGKKIIDDHVRFVSIVNIEDKEYYSKYNSASEKHSLEKLPENIKNIDHNQNKIHYKRMDYMITFLFVMSLITFIASIIYFSITEFRINDIRAIKILDDIEVYQHNNKVTYIFKNKEVCSNDKNNPPYDIKYCLINAIKRKGFHKIKDSELRFIPDFEDKKRNRSKKLNDILD